MAKGKNILTFIYFKNHKTTKNKCCRLGTENSSGLFNQGSPSMCEFSVSRHFLKTNVTKSVAELILYSQKAQNCDHFQSNLLN